MDEQNREGVRSAAVGPLLGVMLRPSYSLSVISSSQNQTLEPVETVWWNVMAMCMSIYYS